MVEREAPRPWLRLPLGRRVVAGAGSHPVRKTQPPKTHLSRPEGFRTRCGLDLRRGPLQFGAVDASPTCWRCLRWWRAQRTFQKGAHE